MVPDKRAWFPDTSHLLSPFCLAFYGNALILAEEHFSCQQAGHCKYTCYTMKPPKNIKKNQPDAAWPFRCTLHNLEHLEEIQAKWQSVDTILGAKQGWIGSHPLKFPSAKQVLLLSGRGLATHCRSASPWYPGAHATGLSTLPEYPQNVSDVAWSTGFRWGDNMRQHAGYLYVTNWQHETLYDIYIYIILIYIYIHISRIWQQWAETGYDSGKGGSRTPVFSVACSAHQALCSCET